MGERKVLNKYYPPDFDPSKIPKRIALKNDQMKVRMMLPMSIRCSTCGTYMYKGTKFNCRKEDVKDDTYLGIMKFRFYFKCTKCSAEMIMKTDPKNSDYEMEAGASRNFEPWRNADEIKEAAKRKREEEEMGDAMKALENRTLDSRMEMDILSALDEMKSMRARQAQLDPSQVLSALQRTAEPAGGHVVGPASLELTEEDEKLVKSIVFRNSENYVRRIDSDEEKSEEEEDGEGGEGERKRSSIKKNSAVDIGGISAGVIGGNGGKSKVTDKWAADKAPVFEVKPVKVGFTVRAKPKARGDGKQPEQSHRAKLQRTDGGTASVGESIKRVGRGKEEGERESTSSAGKGSDSQDVPANGKEGSDQVRPQIKEDGEQAKATLAGLSALYGDDDDDDSE